MKRIHRSRASKRRISICAFSVLLAAFSETAAVSATQAGVGLTQEQRADYQNASENERIRLLITLAKGGEQELAQILLDQFQLRGEHAANRELYVRGLIMRANGDLTGAAKAFRSALASDPGLTLVRSDLAETLVLLEEDDSALHHLKLLQAEAPDKETEARIGSFIQQIDERRPYQFNAYIAAAPTTNVNNGSIRKTVYSPLFGDMVINRDSKKKSGLGVAAGANASFSHRLGNELRAVISGGADARIYDRKEFDTVTVSQAAELRYLLAEGYLSLGAVGSQSLDTHTIEPAYYAFGPRIAARLGLSNKDVLNLGATYEFRNYSSGNTQDGSALMLDTNWQHSIDSTFVTSLSFGFDNVDAKDDTLSYNTLSAGAGFYKELPAGFTVSVNGELKSTEFAEPVILLGKLRQDTRMTGHLGITKRDWNIFGFAPSFDYTYTWNNSNISLYDFDSHAVDLRLTKDF